VIASLVRNKWKSFSPHALDRNYNNNSLEVEDSTGRVVLQVTLLPDRVQLQGEWWEDSVHGFALLDGNASYMGGQMVLFGPNKKRDDVSSIKPMFKYPSDLHLGELVD
jgi:hypothetical protein